MSSDEKNMLDIEQIRATITNLNAETAKLILDGKKIEHDMKYDWMRILFYGLATITASMFLSIKILNT